MMNYNLDILGSGQSQECLNYMQQKFASLVVELASVSPDFSGQRLSIPDDSDEAIIEAEYYFKPEALQSIDGIHVVFFDNLYNDYTTNPESIDKPVRFIRSFSLEYIMRSERTSRFLLEANCIDEAGVPKYDEIKLYKNDFSAKEYPSNDYIESKIDVVKKLNERGLLINVTNQ